MKIDTEGVYTLQYTAEDECGNVTVEERAVSVENITYRTVLYTDGTFIINEKSSNIDANVALHGAATNIYSPFDPNGATDAEKYIFASNTNRPWNDQRANILRAEIGSVIAPTSLSWWFSYCSNLSSIDFDNLDASHITTMAYYCNGCRSLSSLNLDGLNFASIESFERAFISCTSLTHVSGVETVIADPTNVTAMFDGCSALQSVSLAIDTKNADAVNGMFNGCTVLTDISSIKLNIKSGVSSLGRMFKGCMAIESIEIMASAPELFTALGEVFRGCYALKTIYTNADWNINASSQYMFLGCIALQGGAGTAYDSGYTTAAYARIDNPPDAPGYFTLKTA